MGCGLFGCSPGNGSGGPAIETDPGALTGELVTYVADYKDGHSEWWHALRTSEGHEVRLDFDTPPTAATGSQVRVHGETLGERLHVSHLEVLPSTAIAAEGADPELIAYPATDTYALVLVDLGMGVNLSADQALADLVSAAPTAKSFASYYSESSYGKYTVSGDVIGPYSFAMTTCDTAGMYKAIEPMITGTYNHLIYYFNESKLCNFGGLGEEGSITKPAKRTWMNGSLACVVLMQEPGHNLGLMHANAMKCGTTSFSTTPMSSCTITEYGSGMSTMGGGCRQFNAYERWYMQWLTGCNGVRVPASGTFNLLPLENNCSGGSGTQVLQVPFPATLTVNDPQATTTNVNLNNYYVELRTAGGIFDSYSTGRGGGSVTFTAPTVFIYTSDNVRVPAISTGGRGGGGQNQNSVWTELLNMTPSGTSFTGLTTPGQSFTDPAGGATITLTSIGATGASITVTNPNGTGSPTCIDGTILTAPGPTSCAGGTTGTGGTTGAGGIKGAAGTTGSAGTTGMTTGAGGTTTPPTGGTNGTGGTTGTGPGTGGTSVGAGGAAGTTAPGETDMVTSGCACSVQSDPAGNLGFASVGMLGGLACAGALARRRRRRALWSLLVASVGWQLRATPARADGAFPDSQNIMTPASLPNEILLGTNFGLVLSVDGGQTWTWTCEQAQNNYATLYQLGAPPGNRLFGTSLAGLIYSNDSSCSWSVTGGLAVGSVVYDFFPDPTNPDRVLAVVVSPAEAGVVYQIVESADGGATFGSQPLYTAASGDTISGVEISRSTPTTVYLTFIGGASHRPKLAQSTDSGGSWQVRDLTTHLPPGTSFIRLIAIDPQNSQKVFLRIRSPGDGGTTEAVAVTDDGGATASTPLSFPGGILSAFTRMSNGTIVLGGVVGTTSVAYTSADGGSTFQPVPAPQPSFRGLSSRGSTLYVVADNQADGYAIGTSTDLGMTWKPLMGWADSVYTPISAIQTCLMTYCQTDCVARANAGQWSSDMCSATPAPLPVDAGADAQHGGSGLDGGGTAGHAGTDAAVPPGGGKSSGGCHCATSDGPPTGDWEIGGLGLALALAFRRRRGRP